MFKGLVFYQMSCFIKPCFIGVRRNKGTGMRRPRDECTLHASVAYEYLMNTGIFEISNYAAVATRSVQCDQ